MICPNCGKDSNKVERPFYKGGTYHRRRMCKGCGERFITSERLAEDFATGNKPHCAADPKVRKETRKSRRNALNLAMLKHRSRPVWLSGLLTGWAIIADVEDGDFYVYTANGGAWLSGATYKKKWWAYDTIRQEDERRSGEREESI